MKAYRKLHIENMIFHELVHCAHGKGGGGGMCTWEGRGRGRDMCTWELRER